MTDDEFKKLNDILIDNYNRGFVDDTKACRSLYDKAGDEMYQKGLEDAWNAAKQVVLSTEDGGISQELLDNLFSASSYYEVFKSMSISDVLTILGQSVDIEIGDEVVYSDGCRYVVTNIRGNHGTFEGIGREGVATNLSLAGCTKTGKQFSQVAEIRDAVMD